jgi:membrane protease YdiL (CAAX protease family)
VPIAEEIIFRGLIIGKFFKNKPQWGVIVSSFLFGLGHGPDSLFAWIVYPGMGLILGLIYYRTRQLECSIMTHIFHNIFAVAQMML